MVDGLHESIARGEVDLGLARAGPARWPRELAVEALFKIRSVVVDSSGNCATSSTARPDWPSLLRRPWVLPPIGTPLRDRLDEYLRSRGLDGPADTITVSDAAAQSEMLRAGSYLSVASQAVARDLVARGIAQVAVNALAPLDDHIALIWRANARMHPAVLQFKRFVLAHPRGEAA